jgi:hypothetical protein
MAEVEIYADTMTGFSVSKDGTVVKIILCSARPTATGKMEEVPVLVLAMPVKGVQEMLADIQTAVGEYKAGASGPRN